MKLIKITVIILLGSMLILGLVHVTFKITKKHDTKLLSTTFILPDYTNIDMDKAGQELMALGHHVIVKQPKHSVPATLKDGLTSFEKPAIEMKFKPSFWNHMVLEQYPAAGSKLAINDTVTLIAGMHHGAGPLGSWLDKHALSVKIRGEKRCSDCHPKQECVDCHIKIGLK